MDKKETVTLAGTLPYEEATSFKFVDVPKGTSQLATDKVTDISTYVEKSGSPAQTVLVNPASSTELGEDVLLTHGKIANIYSSAKVDPLYIYPVRGGTKLYVRLNENVRASTAEAAPYSAVTLPYSASLTLSVPDALLTTSQKCDVVTEIIGRLISQLYPKGTLDKTKLTELIIGKLH